MRAFISLAAAILVASGITLAGGLGEPGGFPLDDRIEILSVRPPGLPAGALTIEAEDLAYPALLRLVQERIRSYYRPDRGRGFENELLMWPGTIEFLPKPGSALADSPMGGFFGEPSKREIRGQVRCSLTPSANKRFVAAGVGLWVSGSAMLHHWVVLDSQGRLIWEAESEPVDIVRLFNPEARYVQMFPDDGSAFQCADVVGSRGICPFLVADDGKALLRGCTRPFDACTWTLFGRRGKVIRQRDMKSRGATFSPDGSYLMLAEAPDLPPRPQGDTPCRWATSCYDSSGRLLWRLADVVPFYRIGGYEISPSGEKILAMLRLPNATYDACIVDRSGKVAARAGYAHDWQWEDTTTPINWSQDEEWIFLGREVLGADLKAGPNLQDLAESHKPRLSWLRIEALAPSINGYTAAFGFRVSDASRRFKPEESHKFICLLDKNWELVALKFITTEGFAKRGFHIEADPRTGRTYCKSDDTLIEAVVRPPAGR